MTDKEPGTLHGSNRRRLAAIVFADVAGYTELSSRDEDAALRVIGAFQREAKRATADHEGRVVKFLGDGMLAEFNSLDAAVVSSQALQEAFGNMSEAIETDVALRVGVHLGDVMFSDDGDVYGSGVNVAARIESHAPPGGIVVSDSAYRHLRNRKAYQFSSIGEHQLKGVPDPMELYVVLPQDQQAPAPAARVIKAAGPEQQVSPAWKFARWTFAFVVTAALAAYAADLPGVRGSTTRLASMVGFGSIVSPTTIEPPAYMAIDGGAVVDGGITLRFSGPIDSATASRSSIQLLDPDGGDVRVSVVVQSNGMSVDLVPERPLLYASSYRIVITTLLRSAAGTAVELPEGPERIEDRLAFTTQSVPPGAPSLVASTPEAGATDVASDALLTFTFDEVVDASTVDETTVALVDEDGQAVPAAIDCCGEADMVVSLQPAEPLESGSYTVHLGGGLGDEDGEYLAPQSIGFEVAEVVVPPVAATGPGRLAIQIVPAELASRSIIVLDGEELGPGSASARSISENTDHTIEIFGTAPTGDARILIFSETVRLRPAQARTLQARVEPFGTIGILSEPRGTVYIDGVEIGGTPLAQLLVIAGREHTIEVRPAEEDVANYAPYTSKFTVEPLAHNALGRVRLPAR